MAKMIDLILTDQQKMSKHENIQNIFR